jgi:hypothetical protein
MGGVYLTPGPLSAKRREGNPSTNFRLLFSRIWYNYPHKNAFYGAGTVWSKYSLSPLELLQQRGQAVKDKVKAKALALPGVCQEPLAETS